MSGLVSVSPPNRLHPAGAGVCRAVVEKVKPCKRHQLSARRAEQNLPTVAVMQKTRDCKLVSTGDIPGGAVCRHSEQPDQATCAYCCWYPVYGSAPASITPRRRQRASCINWHPVDLLIYWCDPQTQPPSTAPRNAAPYHSLQPAAVQQQSMKEKHRARL